MESPGRVLEGVKESMREFCGESNGEFWESFGGSEGEYEGVL